MTLSRNLIAAIFALIVAIPFDAEAAGAEVKLDRAPIDIHDQASLQRGARVFANYCLSCHSARYMRYNRLTEIGLTEAQIKSELMFATDKVTETMTVAMRKADAIEWFGAVPPDLTLVARSRGADWLYTYLRTFYRDDTRPTGWNNLVYDKVGMPHVMHELQGQLVPVMREVTGEDGKPHQVIERLVLAKPGQMTLAEYDALMADLVNYLTWMGEPVKAERVRIGVGVLIFLALFFVVAFYLKREIWRDVH